MPARNVSVVKRRTITSCKWTAFCQHSLQGRGDRGEGGERGGGRVEGGVKGERVEGGVRGERERGGDRIK